MATRTKRETIAPQLEVSVHWATQDEPVVARLELAQARELIGRLSLMDPDDAGVAAAVKGGQPSHLLLGLQSFFRLILEREGCVALADTKGGLWTIPARSVNAVNVRLTTGVVRGQTPRDPITLRRAFAANEA